MLQLRISASADVSEQVVCLRDGHRYAPDALLDSYQAERLPSARHVIDFSMELGKVICVADAGEATARASSGVTAAGLSRRSTTIISLPMPFILANAWLASALMKNPDLCLPYMASDAGLASAAAGAA